VILIFGGDTLRDFAFAMMVGVLSGTYSSIFIASPVLIAWKEREPAYQSRAARIREQMGTVPAFPEDNEVALVGGEPERDTESERDGGNGSPAEPERPPVAAAPRARSGDGNGAEPVEPEPVVEAEMTERERRLAARRRRQEHKRKHGRNR
jgi:SecD/SecF fusion protein